MSITLQTPFPMKRLGDVAEVERDIVNASDIPDQTHYVGLEHIEGESGAISPLLVTNGDLASAKHRFSPVHVLYGKLRPYLSKIVCPTFAGVCSTDIIPIKPGRYLDRHYLCHILRHPEYIALATSSSQGANLPRLSPRRLEDFEIPFPKLDVQENIAAILDKADAIRRKRQQALRLTDDFLRSVFLDMFGDPVANSKGFPRGTIRDLVESANYGTSEKAHPTDGEYPVLRMNNITYAGGWDLSSLKYVDLESSSAHKYLVSKGQILFNRTNSKELVGKTAVYREEQPMAYAGYLVRVTAKPDADSEYISAYLNSNHGKAILLGMCKSIVGMANINAQEMLSIPILLPPEQLQKRFGDIVRLVETRRESQRQAIEASNALFASLQQRAFSGQL